MTRNLFNNVFVKNILIISALLVIIFLIISFITKTLMPVTEVLISWIISIINFVFGVMIFLYALDKPNKQFLVFSLGSIVLRLFLNIFLVLVLITVFKFQKNYFILSFLVFYFIYLIFEIYLLNKFTVKSKE